MCGIRPRRARQLSCVLAWLIVLTGAEGLADTTAPQTPVDQVASTLHSRLNLKQTPGTVVTLEEVKREQGRHGTRITYRIATSGFPRATTLRMQISSLAIPKPRVLLTGIQADESGSLASGKLRNGETVKFANFDFTIEDYNKGEALKVEMVGEDGSVYAADEVFPFPIEGRDGKCHLWAALLTEDRKTFGILGEGFGPDNDVRTSSYEDDGKDLKEGTAKVGPNDLFGAGVWHTKRGGSGTFSATGPSCQVTLKYDFGRQAKGPQ